MGQSRPEAPGSLAIEGLPRDDRDWVVAWPIGVLRNDPALSEPAVLLQLSQYNGTGSRQAVIGLTHFGQVRPYSVWRNRVFVRDLPMVRREFKVSGEQKCEFQSSEAIARVMRMAPAQMGPLERPTTLRIETLTHTLLIPPLELLSRTYGRSQYVKRILTTLPFQEACDALNGKDRVEQEENHWLVTLDKRCDNDDKVFLAHLRHDELTRACVRNLCGQFQSIAIDPGVRTLVTPEVKPWWPHDARLLCYGIEYRNRPDTFLVFRIDGMSDPDGLPLQVDRPNTNLGDGKSDAEDDVERESSRWLKTRVNPHQAPTELIHTQEPSGQLPAHHIFDAPFQILGKPRSAVHVIRDGQGRRASTHPPLSVESPTAVSAGALRSGNQRPAPVSITAPTQVRPGTIVFAVWSALSELSKSFGASVETWTGSGWCESSDPIPVPLLASDVRDMPSWYYIRGQGGRRSRCYYAARVTKEGVTGYVLEIERRAVQSEGGELRTTEELCGVAYLADGDIQLAASAKSVCEHARKRSGSLRGVNVPGANTTITYRHRFGKLGTLETGITNALERVGCNLKPAKKKSSASSASPCADLGVAGQNATP